MSKSFFTIEEDQEVSAEDKILFRSANEFSIFITNLANTNGESLTTTILNYCEDRDLDPGDIANLISKPLKERLAIEMRESGLLQKDSSAEFDL